MNALSTIAFTFFVCLSSVFAGTPSAGQSLFDYWDAKSVSEVKLYIDLDELEAKRMTEESLTAQLTDGEHNYDLRVDVRGRFRRRNCSMPPMRLHFDKKWLRQSGFSKHNDFKLVTHCTDDAAGQDALLREQLAYELYRTVSPEAAFRTRLLTVTYVNTADGSTTTSYAILIEDTDELEDRLAADNCKECFNRPQELFNNAEKVALFQYMIGNADYSFVMHRNMKLMEQTDGTFTAVPYDFDYSGFVNPTYGRPDAKLGQQRMTDRVWKWEFTNEPALAAARGQFLHQKDALMAQVDNFTELSEDSRKEINKYLRSFFRELKSNSIGRTTAR